MLLLCAGHIQAQLLRVDLAAFELAHDLAAMHDQNAIGEIHDLVQLERNQQHRLARVALSDQLPVNILP